MIIEQEISVLVTSTYEELHNKLIEYGFKIKEDYRVEDYYMIDKNIDIVKTDKLEVLKKCILVRNIIGYEKTLLYKYKEYAQNGDIVKQGKVKCPIEDIGKAIKFMEAINYHQLFKINNHCIVYANDSTELTVQLVNADYIFLEIEDKPNYVNREYANVEEMKLDLEQYDLPYEKNNYFAKKALIMLEKVIAQEQEKI